MLGAIIGDVIGSRFEWHNIKTKEFPLFDRETHFTDDTVTTVAIGSALVMAADTVTGYAPVFSEELRFWCRAYPNVGYGSKFMQWFKQDTLMPNDSFGNGAAMRVSPVAWAGTSLAEIQLLAEISAAVSHNHSEGIKGAIAVASAIYMGRKKKEKTEIRRYIEDNFYSLDFTLSEIRGSYHFDATCQGSVPQAIEAFLEGTDFEDVIRNAISLGGDSDTIAAIAGSIAEAYWGGVPRSLWEQTATYMDQSLLEAVYVFRKRFLTLA